MIVQGCRLCSENAQVERTDRDSLRIVCVTCGTYELTGTAQDVLESGLFAGRRWALSAVTRRASDEGSPAVLVSGDLERLIDSVAAPSSPLAAVDPLLLSVADAAPRYGSSARVNDYDYPRYRLLDREDMAGVIQLLQHLGLAGTGPGDGRSYSVKLTPPGWARVDELRRAQGTGRQAFVAMSFDPSLDLAYAEGIQPALETDCFFTALRVDRDQYNHKIDDHIVSELRRSRFVVADFTMHRAGVYFEAGFGLGLGLQVIYCCRQDDIGNAHFDTRQYNHIVWSTPGELRSRLRERILATILDRSDRATS